MAATSHSTSRSSGEPVGSVGRFPRWKSPVGRRILSVIRRARMLLKSSQCADSLVCASPKAASICGASDCVVAWLDAGCTAVRAHRENCHWHLWRLQAFSLFLEESPMAASDWGLCKECGWWQIDPGATPADNTMGVCAEEALRTFRLRVSGNSGCSHCESGEPTQAAGSSAAPPPEPKP